MRKHIELSRRSLLALGASALGLKAAADDDKLFRVTMGKSLIEVSLPAGGIDLAPPSIMAWVTVAARAVAAYYGEFPTPSASVVVRAVEDRAGVLRGTTYGGDPPRTHQQGHAVACSGQNGPSDLTRAVADFIILTA